jgi:NAD-dependent deacetylase
MDDDAIEGLAADLAAADHRVVFTGAGASTASGIPDFRSEGGIWDRFDQRDFHYQRFLAEPGAFWEDRLDLQAELYGDDTIEPNAAHEAIADLERRGHVEAVITQNVDGLHAEAGSASVVHLHGTSDRVACQDCGERYPAETATERAEAGELPPRCEACEGVLKPDTVLFGERLPTGALQSARRHARDADVFLAVGSSLTVQPAASLPTVAKRNGATLAVVNLEPTGVGDRADYDLRADVTDVLPAVVEAI